MFRTADPKKKHPLEYELISLLGKRNLGAMLTLLLRLDNFVAQLLLSGIHGSSTFPGPETGA